MTEEISMELLTKQFDGTFENPLFKARDIGYILGIEKVRNTVQEWVRTINTNPLYFLLFNIKLIK